jgi:hypothetical protein
MESIAGAPGHMIRWTIAYYVRHPSSKAPFAYSAEVTGKPVPGSVLLQAPGVDLVAGPAVGHAAVVEMPQVRVELTTY